MRTRPANPNNAHRAEHTLYLAVTGGGKSQAVNHNLRAQLKPGSPARVVLWDQAGDYPGHHFETRKGFLQALKKAVASGKGYRIAFAGPVTAENWEWWCECVWSILDGRHETYAIAEELSAVSPSVSKASPNAAILLNQGRKYGLKFHGVSQKPQEVAKTFFDQCPLKWIGQQKGKAMRRRMAEELGISQEQVHELGPLEFFVDDGSAKEPEKTRIKYRKITGVKWQ